MNQSKILTLLSDFGDHDVYVGVMKGVIAQINPNLLLIDLTHQIPPQNIPAARFCLMNSYAYFPMGTVHLAVVDPGVGSQRRAIALKLAQGYLVGPDNGIFSGIISQNPVIAAVELTNTNYWRTPQPSSTFHGRDIFAPVAAHLASGVNLQELGREINPETLVKLNIGECYLTNTGVAGCIQYIDHFGNLVSNIPGSYVQGKTWGVEVQGLTIPGCATYSDVKAGEALALIGSHGWVEIAVNGGNAQIQLQINGQYDLHHFTLRLIQQLPDFKK
ncbi:SAM-dependent chlorinase/fluorinase [Sphaerospermopsis aphanizomenoides BCCUSP55]|uniref:SAM hydrolase/SAM-dependent halogenase family protein n=1 Tax=Sphaerospermopsis aphanizomenoides TaxID=459663 RepID=UPI001908444C|nr:SAM-dependent chlorinase/fluorinase [Sphaerospermopsis aphanizomenoides]MBK1987839.1 SAM-dependent chlorinase/fluorinase [Sphaerospermopsis aphanizomenoides BCCUSP55]